MKIEPAADLNALNEFIKSASAPGSAGSSMNKFPFITISRQTGAGGHSLAEAVLSEMKRKPSPLFDGWRVLDQELCAGVLEDPKLKVPLDSLLKEKFVKEMEDYLSQMLSGTSPQIAVFHKTAKLIRAFAAAGKVIVVGRAGSLLTRNLPLGIHVRLVASLEARVNRMMRQFRLGRAEAEKQVKEQDASRALMVRSYFNGKDINDPLLYDAVWNTDSVSIPEIASVLARMVEEKARSGAAKGAVSSV